MTAETGLSRNEFGSFVLSAALDLTIAGVSQKKAEKREAKERKPCKHSNRP
jgi:hypothetical protein